MVNNPYAPPQTNSAPPYPGYAPSGQGTYSRPASVTTAAIFWIIYGGLGLLGNLISLVNGAVGGGVFGLLISAVFLSVGISSIRGKAKDTLGNAIGSLVLGGLGLLGSIYLMTINPAVGVVTILFVLLLVVAGILALIGRQGYRDWVYHKNFR